MAEPTLVAYSASNYADNTSPNTTGSVSGLAGDTVYVLGATGDNPITLATPTATGLTFTLVTSVGTTNNTRAYLWKATAAGSFSTAVTSTVGGVASFQSGISVFVYRDTDGNGTPVTLSGSANKTITVARGQANSHIWVILADWNALTGTAAGTPAGSTKRTEQPGDGATWGAYLYSWGDQGGTGSTAYGITLTGTSKMTGIAVEILGTAGGGGTDQPIEPRGHQVPGMFQGGSLASRGGGRIFGKAA